MAKDWSYLEGRLLIAIVWGVQHQERNGRTWTMAEADLIDATSGEVYARVERFIGMLGNSLGELPDFHDRWFAGRIVQRVSSAMNPYLAFEESQSEEDIATAGRTYARLAERDEAAARNDEESRLLRKLESDMNTVESVLRERERLYGKEAADRSRDRFERTGILLWNPGKD